MYIYRCDCSGVDNLARQLHETLHAGEQITPLKDTVNTSSNTSRYVYVIERKNGDSPSGESKPQPQWGIKTTSL